MSLYVLPKNPHEHLLFRDYKVCMSLFVATDKIFVAAICERCAGLHVMGEPENAKTPPVLEHRERLE